MCTCHGAFTSQGALRPLLLALLSVEVALENSTRLSLPPKVELVVEFVDQALPPVQCKAPCKQVALGAGHSISKLRLLAPSNGGFKWNQTDPQVRIVRSYPALVSRESVLQNGCPPAADTKFVSWHEGARVAKGVARNHSLVLEIGSLPLHFKMGGMFKLCYSFNYSHNSSFGPNMTDLVPIWFHVRGAYDERGPVALAQRMQYCFVLQARSSPVVSCIISFERNNSGLFGSDVEKKEKMRGTWTAEWNTSYFLRGIRGAMSTAAASGPVPSIGSNNVRIWQTDGNVSNVVSVNCSVSIPAPFLCYDSDSCAVGDHFIDTGGKARNQVNLPVGKPDLFTADRTFRPFTVAACFCPNTLCSAPQHFVQKVGVIHFFVAKFCLPDPERPKNDSRCLESFTSTSPMHKVQIHVVCPTDACRHREDPSGARVKLVAIDPGANNLQTWDRKAGCRAAPQTPLYTSPSNCESPTLCRVSGGQREDVKIFGGDPHDGLSFHGNLHPYARIAFHAPVDLDVCFCIGSCVKNTLVPNFFKVGTISLVPLQLLPETPGGAIALDIVNVPGFIGFHIDTNYRRIAVGLGGEGIVKPLRDDSSKLTSTDCASTPYSVYKNESSENFLLLGIGTGNNTGPIVDANGSTVGSSVETLHEAAFSSKFRGQRSTHNASHFTFNDADPSNRLLVRRAGVIAVCYCGILDSAKSGQQKCKHPSFWRLIWHITVRGPTVGSDLKPFQKFKVSTYTFFRLVFSGWGLLAGDTLRILRKGASCSEPDRVDPSITTGCPSSCAKQIPPENGNPDLRVSVLGFSTVGCHPRLDGHCSTIFVDDVKVLGPERTQLSFRHGPGLRSGDVISLGEGFECASDCTEEDLMMLRGMGRFSNISGTDAGGGEYLVGRRVEATEDPKTILLDIGWPLDKTPSFQVVGNAGRWTRHNVGETREEIYSEETAVDLPVCWSHSDDLKYVAQAGSLTMIAPAIMPKADLYLSGIERGRPAPVIINFATGDAVDKVAPRGSTQLILRILDTSRFSARFSDPEGAELAEVLSRSTPEGAHQTSCGRLLKELWSDAPNGFPLPHGCYHQRLSASSWDIGLVFAPLSGLEPHKLYQIVINGVVRGNRDDEVVRLISMDDLEKAPYHAIELGKAFLRSLPKDAGQSADAKLVACKVIGGNDGVVQLSDPAGWELRLQGGTGRSIQASAYLRLFLWPLTHWRLGPTCATACVPSPGYACGELGGCGSEAIVPSFNTNVLKLALPADMDGIRDEVQHRLIIRGLSLSDGGFFPTKFGAQVTRATFDDRPSYVVSTGDHLYLQPTAVGGLVDTATDGDQQPFKGALSNVLYARLILGATLFSADIDYGASMAIHLPPGYTCVVAGDVESNLAVFGRTYAQGRGTLDSIGWSSQGGTCWYHFRHRIAAFAGTAFMVKIIVNNPVVPLRREDVSNAWTMTLKSMGTFSTHQEVSGIPFDVQSFGKHYAANKAVLGIITDAVMQPSDFQLGGITLDGQRYKTQLRIFFRTEQGISSGARLEVIAPDGFDFGELCQASDLDAADHYASGGSEVPTLRLPVIESCKGQVSAGEKEFGSRNMAVLLLGRYLLGGRLFAFQLEVHPPPQYRLTQQQGQAWLLYTREPSGGRTDGTPATVPLGSAAYDALGSQMSWGMFARQPAELVINMSSLQPFALTGQESYVHVLFRLGGKLPISSTLRLTAPVGFVFSFPDEDFVSRANASAKRRALTETQPNRSSLPSHRARKLASDFVRDGMVIGATADWPAHTPSLFGHVMLWSEALFLPDETYGFVVPIRIPNHSPRQSPNVGLLEWGYTDDRLVAEWTIKAGTACGSELPLAIEANVTLELCQAACVKLSPCIGFEFDRRNDSVGTCHFREACNQTSHGDHDFHVISRITRPYAAVLDTPLVQALLDAKVGYQTSAVSAANVIQFQFQVVTPVPAPSAGIIIRPPAGFVFSEACFPKSLRPTALHIVLPPANDLECSFLKVNGVSQIRLRPRVGTIDPGLYAFDLDAVNPTVVQLEDRAPDPNCGTARCWYISSHIDASDLSSAELDLRTAAASFEVLNQMVAGLLISPNVDYLLSTGRNDRPGARNNLLFSFLLNTQEIIETRKMKLRGPLGFDFDEDCLPSFIIGDDVFGRNQKYPPQYKPFEPDVRVTACHGELWQATVTMTPGLLSGRLYVFRIGVRNPSVVPSWNKWTIEFSDEACAPFPSFPLWEIHHAKLDFVVEAAGDRAAAAQSPFLGCLASKDQASNRLTLPIRLQLRPQSPFERVELRAPIGWRPEPATFCVFVSATAAVQKADWSCTTEQGSRTVIVERLQRVPWPGLANYELWVDIEPPHLDMPTTETWEVDTFRVDVPSGGGVVPSIRYDVGTARGAKLHSPVRIWGFVNLNEEYSGSALAKLLFGLAPAVALENGDTIAVIAPPGFSFSAPGRRSGSCRLFAWADELPRSQGSNESGALAACGAAEVQRSSNASLAMSQITCSQREMRITVRGLLVPYTPPEIIFEDVDCRACPALDDVGIGNVIEVISSSSLAGCSAACGRVAPLCTGVLWRKTEKDCHLLRSSRCSRKSRKGYTCQVLGLIVLESIVLNPALPPKSRENFWLVRHQRGTAALGSAAAESWPVVPILLAVGLDVAIGALRASGSIPSILAFRFRTLTAASRLRLRIRTPFGFNFTSARPLALADGEGQEVATGRIFSAPYAPEVLEMDFAMQAMSDYNITLGGVALPPNAGQVVFDVETVSDDFTAVASRLEEVDGFYVPGRLSVKTSELVTEMRGLVLLGQQVRKGDVRPGLPARWSETAFVIIYFDISVPVSIGERLRVISPGIRARAQGADVSEVDEGAGSNAIAGAETDDDIFVATFMRPLKVGTTYALSLPVLLPDVEDTVGQDVVPWTIDVIAPASMQKQNGSKVGDRVLCTNDGLFVPAFGISTPYELEFSPTQVAPNSVTEMTVTVLPGMSRPAVIEVVAPLRTKFPLDCLAFATRSVQACESGEMVAWGGSVRSVALLTLTRAAQIESAAIRNVVLIVQTPFSAQLDAHNVWLVLGRRYKGGPVVGWGEAAQKYEIVSMPVSLSYVPQPGNHTMMVTFGITPRALGLIKLAGSSAKLRIQYGTQEDEDAGVVGNDDVFRYRCDVPEKLTEWVKDGAVWRREQAWLPLGFAGDMKMRREDCMKREENATYSEFSLSGLETGSHAFTVEVSLLKGLVPARSPYVKWDVTLFDQLDNVVDMYSALTTLAWQQKFGFKIAPLVWESAAPDKDAKVTVLLEPSFKDDDGLQLVQLSTLCLSLPDNVLFVGGERDVRGEELEIQPQGWKWATSGRYWEDRLCIQVDPSNISLQEGGPLNGLTAKVRLPKEKEWPTVNVWLVDVCDYDCSKVETPNVRNSTGNVSGGLNPDGSSSGKIKGTSPLLGFEPNEEHPEHKFVPTSYTRSRWCSILSLALIVLTSVP